jgi:hypothetical protein
VVKVACPRRARAVGVDPDRKVSSEGTADQGADRRSGAVLLIGGVGRIVLQIGGMFVLQIGGMIFAILPQLGGIRAQFSSVFSMFVL